MKSFSELSKYLNEQKNSDGTIEMTVPFFIRMLEYAREDAKTDMDLHKVAERIVKLNKVADMSVYDKIIKG